MIVVAVIELAQGPGEIRVDTFDKNSTRTGYIVIDPRTGRVDQFDTRGNRLGYGTMQRPGPSDMGTRNPDRYRRRGIDQGRR